MTGSGRNALIREPGISPQETAAYWLMRAQSDSFTAADRVEFNIWLAQGSDHARIYESVKTTWELAGTAATAPEILARREQARINLPERSASWRGLRAMGMAAAMLLAVLVGVTLWQRQGIGLWRAASASGEAYETEVGERSTVPLADGSTLTLNTASRARVMFSSGERAIVLERGQALFQVARDARRPFTVMAADRRITALGTSFDVRVEDHRVEVTLLDGRIAVEPSHSARPVIPTILKPGQQLIATAAAPPQIRVADTAQVASWKEGRLIFQDEALPLAVAEVNRYARTKLVLSDPRLATLRISGVFTAGEPDRFLDALMTAFPVTALPSAQESQGGSIRLFLKD